jgi:trimethylamine:corrinoid methyltransferase-like protein
MKREYFFTDGQIEQIREGALSILSEIGVKLGRQELVSKLAAKGFRTSGSFVRIEKETARKKIESQKSNGTPPERSGKRTLRTYTSAYSHTYENIDGSLSKITTESHAEMTKFVAHAAPVYENLGVSCPGPPPDVLPDLQFLRQAVNGFIWCKDFYPMEVTSLKTAPYYFELCEAMGKPVDGAPIYVASPLNISGESFDIALEYSSKFKGVGIGSMPCLGANTPLNLIAAYAQTVAETVGGAIVYEELTGVPASYGTGIFPFDFYLKTHSDTSVQPQPERDKTVAGNGDGSPSEWGELLRYS